VKWVSGPLHLPVFVGTNGGGAVHPSFLCGERRRDHDSARLQDPRQAGEGDHQRGRFLADPKEFSTVSLGWNISEKTVLEVNGEPQRVQIGLNLTIAGSKELPKEPQ
jgi:hypothetical protein